MARLPESYISNYQKKNSQSNSIEENNIFQIEKLKIQLEELENVNAYLYSIEALMERIIDIKVSDNVEAKFKETFKKANSSSS